MRRHRLRREIIATVIANDMVNLCGPTFPARLMAAAGCGIAELVVSFEAAREVLRLRRGLGAGRGARRQGAGGRPDWPSSASSPTCCAARPSGWRGARRAATTALGVDALIAAYRPAGERAEGPLPAGALAVRAEGGGAPGGRLDQGRRAEGDRPPDRALPAAVDRPGAGRPGPRGRAGRWRPAAQLYHHIGGAFAFDRLRAAAGSRDAPATPTSASPCAG